MTVDVAIIGAGISGLSTAYDLQQLGYNVVVLERQVRPGGNAVSEKFGGFLMEHGPSSMNAAVPEAVEFSKALGLLQNEVNLSDQVKQRYLLSDNTLTGISTHPMGFLRSNYLSLRGKARMMTEILRPRRVSTEEETIHAFTTRRFGREFADKVMEPLAAGLFAGDAQQLSVSALFPKLVEYEQTHGSITRAIIAARRGSEPGRRLFSWSDGIAMLPHRLADHLKDKLQLGITVRRIRHGQNGFTIDTGKPGKLQARALVLAVQPMAAASLLEDLEAETATALGAIAAPPLSVVFLGYKRGQVDHPLDGIGFLSMKNNRGVLTGAQFCSTMFAGRAPDNHVSIACYVGGMRQPEAARLPGDQLTALVHDELSDILNIKGQPIVSRLRQWPLGLPQYSIGHQQRLKVIETSNERLPGLFLTGNYLTGVSMANCLARGRQTAQLVNNMLQGGISLDISGSVMTRQAHSRKG